MPKAVDITGQRFGRLVVYFRDGSDKFGNAAWGCLCDCGRGVSVPGLRLKSGNTRSCGCLFREMPRKGGYRHGYASAGRTSTYHSWSSMWTRCTNPTAINYDRYGGRGIGVCAQWRDFARFLTDMGERPEGCTLDRIDNNGNYTPENCRWATLSEQAKNQADPGGWKTRRERMVA